MTRSTGVVTGVGRSQEDLGGISGSHPSGHARCAVGGASRVDPGRTAHTSGPWQRKSDYEPTVIIGNVDGEIHPDGSSSYTYDFIANLEDEYGGSPPNAYANAALILAAPELLERLEDFCAIVKDDELLALDPDLADAVASANAVIAKALGESQ
jgi:hypothetical protein